MSGKITDTSRDMRKKIWGVYPSRFRKIVHINAKKQSPIAEGVSAKFWKNGKVGIKGYHSMEEAIEAYEIQTKASRKGIGPETGKLVIVYVSAVDGFEQFSKWDRMPDVYFGFETQIAKSPKCDWSRYAKQHPILIEKLKKMGLGDDSDLSDWRNFGFLGKKLVSIDFGSESFFEDDNDTHWFGGN